MTESKPNLDSVLAYLADVVDQRRADLADGKIDASSSYIAQLFTKGDDAILKKIGEEATETVMAAKDSRQHQLDPKHQALLVGEMADLWFHCLVVLAENEDAVAELGWQPYSVDRGFKAGDNVVTVQSVVAISATVSAAMPRHWRPMARVPPIPGPCPGRSDARPSDRERHGPLRDRAARAHRQRARCALQSERAGSLS